ncbi:MAG: hypothetical protein EAZ97_04205 [Bacteroidetes bacterium]|nr:MAG: hypothetical protein EAZ97_04205 [Bacteroidota bacterium]
MWKQILKDYGTGILNSYGRIFFSNNHYVSALLMGISFIDFNAGISGFCSIILTQWLYVFFGYGREYIRSGNFTYNSLIMGLLLGVYYQFNIPFCIIYVCAILAVFFLNVWLATLSAKRGFPYLTLPFLMALWVIKLGVKNLSTLKLNERGIYTIADLDKHSDFFSMINNFLLDLHFADSLGIYFKSLGAILFQYNLVAGVLVAAALFYYSRISFLLSLLGFYVGYEFYKILEGDLSPMIYSYIGFNFILTAIALGGFFVVPSTKSFFLVIIIVPLTALLGNALSEMMGIFGLPMHALPFNMTVILVISALRLREKTRGLDLVVNQQFVPEKNHYKHINRLERFKTHTYFQIFLPFVGVWHVPQGYFGGITHLGDWGSALDFDIIDQENKTYRSQFLEPTDFHCYNLPVLAPANGIVWDIVDGISDNLIGGMDMKNNWGNTIIIKHGEGLYSKLSHLKAGTFRHYIGNTVKKGEIVGYCGNSGRSPEPHLHFQMQTYAYVGSPTLAYPIAYYLVHKNDKIEFNSFNVPKQGELLSNITTTPLLLNAFYLTPGRSFVYEMEQNGKKNMVKWEIFTDSYNQTYIKCYQSNSYAYFVNDGTLFYFTDFIGDEESLLHYFYMGLQKILLGYYQNLTIKDRLLIDSVFNPAIKFVHDMSAPFVHYCKAKYESSMQVIDNEHYPQHIEINSLVKAQIFGFVFHQIKFSFQIKDNIIQSFTIIDKNKTLKAQCISS